MAIQSTPLISLQAPKDVSLGQIETELAQIWQGAVSENGPGAMRATTFSLVVYAPEAIQQLLATLGFYTGPIDGIDGPRTRAAIRAAQTTYGLPENGKASEALLDKLRQDLADRQSVAGGMGVTHFDYAVDAVGAIADDIANQNPCRIISLFPIAGEDTGVTAQVSAYCPINKRSENILICCEYITLKGTEAALERVSGLVTNLMIPQLPKFVWWKAPLIQNPQLFESLAIASDCMIVDSDRFPEPKKDLLHIQALVEKGINVADLNWRRLAAWQELTAEAFDPPERRAAIREVDQVTLDYEKGNPAQALMFLGWLGSRLQWQPTGMTIQGGDYDIHLVHLVAADQRPIEAELAAIPTAAIGEALGDLIDIKLMSTNLTANCCTIICSETGGCMRMEAGGGAETCQTLQVSPLPDQTQERLLSQQLQRWGRDALYEESLAVTAEILRLV
jgi:glucose-6-phosphate dehydrogenase assembly protein OpcA